MLCLEPDFSELAKEVLIKRYRVEFQLAVLHIVIESAKYRVYLSASFP